ncbi:hypothetical protein GCM10023184_28040 [Flaviaesturariibacter amylovorans]|uniref:Uncharacterized protein n=1 Tax=Flaviaesturariibacter amylovorans TaxID=1084520 RepID=A0ABP8H4Q1_9BACT
MLDLTTCMRVLNKSAELPFSEGEVARIATILWQLAEINCDIFLNEKNEQKHETSDSGNPGKLR